MTIDAVSDESKDYWGYSNSVTTKSYLLPIEKLVTLIQHRDGLSLSEKDLVVINLRQPQWTPLDRALEARGVMFAPPNYSNSRSFSYALADQNQPDIILCKNIFRKAKDKAQKLAKKVAHEVKNGAKKVVEFVKEHKTEIIIGAIIVAAAVVIIATAGAAAPEAGSGAAAAIGALGASKKDDEDEKDPSPPKIDPSLQPTDPLSFISTSAPSTPDPFPSYVPISPDQGQGFPPPPSGNPPASNFTPTTPPASYNTNTPPLTPPPNIAHNYESRPIEYRPWENPFPPGVSPVEYLNSQPVVSNVAQPPSESHKTFVDPDGPIGIYHSPAPSSPSQTFTLPGKKLEGGMFIGMNGIGNTLQEAEDHARYLQKLSGGYQFNWVYSNCEWGPLDLFRAIERLHGALSPEAILLQNELKKFHDENSNNPNAKCLITCHSRGSIDVRNALQHLPLEIRNRVIVVAIAPVVVVPKALCFRSFNYASENDLVPQLESLVLAGTHTISPEYLALKEEMQKELIMIEPHPKESRILDHGLQSQTYVAPVAMHYREHAEGNYDVKPYGASS